MPQPEPRPGHDYVDAVAAKLPWAGRDYADREDLSDRTVEYVSGTQLIADVLEALATMGLLRGAERHHLLSPDEAQQVARYLLELLPPGSAAAARYGPQGYGTTGVLRAEADVEYVVAATLTAATDPQVRQAVHDSRRALRRYLEARETAGRG